MFVNLDAEKVLNEVLKDCGYNANAVVTFSDRPDLCDFQCNVAFSLAKELKKPPFVLANEIKAAFEKKCDDFSVSVAGAGFINLTVKDCVLQQKFKNLCQSESLGAVLVNKKIVVDYGGANIAKPLHVGHLRSAIIGQTLCNLARFCGCEVIGDAHLGDWGLQMGLTVLYFMENYDCSPFFEDVNFKAEFINESTLEFAYPRSSAKSKEDEDYKNKARDITTKIQTKQKGYYEIYNQIYNVSLSMIKKTYNKLGCKFDLFLGEKDAQDYVDDVIKIFSDKDLLKESDGALIVEISTESDTAPMPPMLVKATSGADLYATSECATLLMREKTINADEYWYVTDARQALHFMQVFRACRKAGIAGENKILLHLPFGTMNGSDGKPFKTRSGDILKLDDLIEQIEAKAKEKLAENGTPDVDHLSSKIALSALKFGDLINFRGKDIMFDVDRMLAFEGKTGPYIQYSLVRMKSILSKTNGSPKLNFESLSQEVRALMVKTLKLCEGIESALSAKSPNLLAFALYEVCAQFSTFYANTKILSQTDETLKSNYLALTQNLLTACQKCANILGIEIPNKM